MWTEIRVHRIRGKERGHPWGREEFDSLSFLCVVIVTVNHTSVQIILVNAMTQCRPLPLSH